MFNPPFESDADYFAEDFRGLKIILIMAQKIYDRAGFSYFLVENVEEKIRWKNYVGFKADGTPMVIRNGKQVLSSFFSDGKGRWARLINSTDPAIVAKKLKSTTEPAIALRDGKLVTQFIPMIGVRWHDANGNIFFLVSKYEQEEMQADHLGYVTAESDGTYEGLHYLAHNGNEFVDVPTFLYNEKNRKFRVGVNFKKMAYDEMRRRGNASIAVKNKMVYARKAGTNEPIMAHTNGAYESAYTASGEQWVLEYVGTNSGSWTNSTEEFFKRYEFFAVAEDGRAIFAPKDARYVWVHLFGDFIGCMPNWGDAMTAMSNPQVNITNPSDVYACSYIEFYGKENEDGAYVVVQELFVGAPEPFVLEFTGTLAGYLETTFGIPKSMISASNLSNFLKETLGVPELEGVQAKVKAAVA